MGLPLTGLTHSFCTVENLASGKDIQTHTLATMANVLVLMLKSLVLTLLKISLPLFELQRIQIVFV